VKLRLPGRRRGSTHEERRLTSAGSGASPSSAASQDTSPGPGPTPETSDAHSGLEIKWGKTPDGMRSFTYCGVEYLVFGQRAGEYFLGINTAGVKMGGTLDHGPFQTLEDCKARIRARLDEDIRRYGSTTSD